MTVTTRPDLPVTGAVSYSPDSQSELDGGDTGLTEFAGVSGLVLLLDHLSDVTLESGNVAQWSDRSASQAHATQSDSSKQPLLNATGPVNSLRSVSFDGVDEFLTMDSHISKFSSLTESSIFIVYDLPNTTGNDTMLSMTDSTDTNTSFETEFTIRLASSISWVISDLGTNLLFNNFTAATGSNYLEAFSGPVARNLTFLSTLFDKTSALGNGSTQVSFADLTSPDRFRVGMSSYNAVNGGDTNFFEGDIVMIIAFDHGLSSSEASLVQAEISSLTGL